MQALNAYVAEASRGGRCAPTSLLFHVQQGGAGCSTVQAELPAHGSLGPLFHAFGLASSAEVDAGAGLLGSTGEGPAGRA